MNHRIVIAISALLFAIVRGRHCDDQMNEDRETPYLFREEKKGEHPRGICSIRACQLWLYRRGGGGGSHRCRSLSPTTYLVDVQYHTSSKKLREKLIPQLRAQVSGHTYPFSGTCGIFWRGMPCKPGLDPLRAFLDSRLGSSCPRRSLHSSRFVGLRACQKGTTTSHNSFILLAPRREDTDNEK